MTTLYWHEPDAMGFGGKVHIEMEGTVSPELQAVLGGLDGLRGGPPNNKGEYVPIRPEHSVELRAATNTGKNDASG